MYATQAGITRQRREVISQPYELTIIEDEIHKFPECIRKSMKQNRHRHKTNYLKNRPRNTFDLGTYNCDKLDVNINICRALHKEQELEMFHSISPPKKKEEFDNTADRMYEIRRRLSPVKITHKPNPRGYSEELGRERPNNNTVFLNIEKLNLIKIYSQAEKGIEDTSRGNSLESRYLASLDSKAIETRDAFSPYKQEKEDFKEVVVNLRKTLREGYSLKLPNNHFKVRNKQFVPPFERYYYRDFIWKIAFSNGMYLQCIPQEAKYKVFVGRGNNSQLVRSLLKRRPWWTITERLEQANFVWTQLKVNSYFALQTSSESQFKQIRKHIPKDMVARNEHNLKIMNENDVLLWDAYLSKHRKIQERISQDLSKRKFYLKKQPITTTSNKVIRIQNHFPQNYIIGNKKALLYTMTQYYQSIGKKVFNYLPLSFHIKKGINDEEYTVFLRRFYQRRKQGKLNGFNNVWIVKPGELTNRGNGIIVCFSLQEIKGILKRGGVHNDGTPKTFIVQEYIQKPFLYHRRKFDIRHYMLGTIVNGRFKGYWFKRGYIRTSSTQYTLMHTQANVHLTNDAVQKLLPQYGKYQKGNKLSYEQLQTYLQKECGNKYNFFEDVYPQLKSMATDALKASSFGMDPSRKQNNFQLFGMDFMIDSQFKPWLIQINSNPCLQLSCPLLADIIPSLIQNTLKICVDSIVVPGEFQEKRSRFHENWLVKNEFELVYDSTVDWVGEVKELDKREFEEDDQVFEDDGEALED